MHQMTEREAELLAAETPTNVGHYSLYLELAPNAHGEALSFQRLCHLLGERLHMLPGLRRRIRQVPLGLDLPWWIEDPHFDLDYHVRHLAIPGRDSDLGALNQLLGRLHERPLHRNRPLWEVYLIDLENNFSGLFLKMHHALVEGDMASDLFSALASDIVAPPSSGAWRRQDMIPSDGDLLIRAGWSMVRNPVRGTATLLKSARGLPLIGRSTALAVVSPWFSGRRGFELPESDAVVPRVSFNRTIGPHRRIGRVSLNVDDIRTVRKHFDVRFNDVVLSVISGALRQWMLDHDELPQQPLVALTPMMIDSDADALDLALIALATQCPDPVERLGEIARNGVHVATTLNARSATSIRDMFRSAPAIAGLASRLIVRTGAFNRLSVPFNLFIINVPGAAQDFSIDGRRIVHQYPLLTLIDGTGLAVGATSHGGVADICLVADRELVADLDAIAERMIVELELLRVATGADVIAARSRRRAKS